MVENYEQQKQTVLALIEKITAKRKKGKLYFSTIARRTTIDYFTVDKIVEELEKEGKVEFVDTHKLYEERLAKKQYPNDLDIGDMVTHSHCYEDKNCSDIGEEFEVTYVGWSDGGFYAKKVNESDDPGILKEIEWEKKHFGHEGIYVFSRNEVRKVK